MNVLDDGHIYWIPNLETPSAPVWKQKLASWLARKTCRLLGGQSIVFLKRSSKMVEYGEEWPGSNTQEIIRVVYDRSLFLQNLGPCEETGNAMSWLELALYEYESRAWRRKQQRKNKHADAQADVGDISATRDYYKDVPFRSGEVLGMETGLDGHVIVPLWMIEREERGK
jgi:hypothetical protein